MKREKIVLAYSGGLDTSVLVRILTEDYGYDVSRPPEYARTIFSLFMTFFPSVGVPAGPW